MNTTELIALLQKNEFGGITGRPREISFRFRDMMIADPDIEVVGTGDGLITDIELELVQEDDNRVYYSDDGEEYQDILLKYQDLLLRYREIGTPEEIEAIIDRYGRGLTLRSSVAERLDLIKDIPDERLKEIAAEERKRG